jgi:hypothetical protein
MKHISTRTVFEYWDRRRANRRAPDRGDIDPAAIRRALGDTFMLAADFADQLRFRLAGTRVCALFGRELKGEVFTALWDTASNQAIEELLTIVTGEAAGAVAGLTGRTEEGAGTEIEMLLLPLAHDRRACIRALGVLVPMVSPYWLGTTPVTALELVGLRYIGPQVNSRSVPRLGRAAEASRWHHGFKVYSGGLETPPGERTD